MGPDGPGPGFPPPHGPGMAGFGPDGPRFHHGPHFLGGMDQEYLVTSMTASRYPAWQSHSSSGESNRAAN